MRTQLLPRLAAVSFLMAGPAWCQNAPLNPNLKPLTAVKVGVSRPLALPSKDLALGWQTWPQELAWQKAPDGVGEIMAFAGPFQPDFVWGKRLLVGTAQGLLCRDGKQWRVVPALYGQAVRVVAEAQELLWAEQGSQGLVALDQNLEVVRRFPSVKGHCIAVESQGFWCLDDPYRSYWDGSKDRALVEYDAAGREKRRFVVKDLALSTPPPAKQEEGGFGGGRQGGIVWAAVDADWVWVSLNDYHAGRIGGNDAPMRAGTEKLGRLNRTTGEFTLVEWPPAPREPDSKALASRNLTAEQFINLPDQVQWLSSVGLDAWDVCELDKHSLQVTRVLKLIAPNLEVTTKGPNLWLQPRDRDARDRETRIYARANFEPVPRQEAGEPPAPRFGFWSPFAASNDNPWLQILSADEKGIWLSAPENSLLTIRDDGHSTDYDARSILGKPLARFARQSEGALLLSVPNQLMQLAGGKNKQLSLSGVWSTPEARREVSVSFLTSGGRRVWFQTDQGQLVTLNPDFSEPREIGPSPLFSKQALERANLIRDDRGSLAVGDFLYVWAESGDLLRVDGRDGSVEVVTSWTGGALASEAQISSRRSLGVRGQSSFALPDGRIAFKFAETRKTRMIGPAMVMDEGQVDKAHLFLFDPTKNSWQESGAPTNVHPLPAGQKLFGCDATRLFEWRRDSWALIGKRPLTGSPLASGQEQFPPSDIRVFGTEKYLYQETALGIFRAPWTQLGAR